MKAFKKTQAFILAAVMFFTMLPGTTLAADGTITTSNTYNLSDYGNGSTITIGAGLTVTLVGDATTYSNVQIACGAGVNLTLNNVKIDDSGTSGACALSFTGTGNTLTLAGENTLKSGGNHPGVKAAYSTELTIQGGDTDKLAATGGTGSSDGGAGIGGERSENGGKITINGGMVTAQGGNYSYYNGAGIGGSRNSNSGGSIIINGGTVTANGGPNGVGIGGGMYGSGGSITINGGTIVATGGSSGAGIGGGTNGAGGTIVISGGGITASGGNRGAGIGGGVSAQGGNVTISGGVIAANGGINGGTGIGGGANSGGSGGNGGNLNISGGTVNATGSQYGAGIGGGGYTLNFYTNALPGDGGTVKLSGGTVTATGGTGGAGIGGGNSTGSNGTVRGSGAAVTLGGNIGIAASLSGGTLSGSFNGSTTSATITGSTITLSGGMLTATGGDGARGIGGGKGASNQGTLAFDLNTPVLTRSSYGGSIMDTGDGKYTVTAIKDGYVIDQLWVDGTEVSAASGQASYTVTSATKSVVASFAYTVNFPEPAHGTLTVTSADSGNLLSGEIVHGGEKLTIEAHPLEGYVLSSLTVNGVDVTQNYDAGNSYTFTVGGKATLDTHSARTLGSSTVSTKGANIVASFAEVKTYSVTYDGNGGTGSAPTESEKAAGATFKAAGNTFTPPAGKQFKEWNTAADKSGTGYLVEATVTMPGSNLTLYAIWEDIPISADVTWGSMDFTYSDGTWNQNTHEYEGDGWSSAENANKISVTSTSNIPLTVSYSYSQGTGYDAINGSFTNGMNPITSPLSLPAGGIDNPKSCDVFLILSGKPPEIHSVKIGSVTVTITTAD